MRYFITGQRSDVVSPGSTEHTASELEVLMEIKFNVCDQIRSYAISTDVKVGDTITS